MSGTFNRPPPPGFRGLHPDLPITCYERNLPHWRQKGATYFVTFRLADSLPQGKLHELAGLKAEWERKHPPPRSKQDWETISRETEIRVERWLDEGIGECVLRDRRHADTVTSAMHHFDGARYELGAYVVMPNHIHAIVRSLEPQIHPLEDVIGSWKQYSARRINAARSAREPLWQEETFDRIIRDEEHLERVLQYIVRNPKNASLRPNEFVLWVRPEWEAIGWMFEARKPQTS